MTGILTGIGSIGLYYLMSNPKEQIQIDEENQEDVEVEDQEELDNKVNELKLELQSYPSEPEYCKDENGAEGFTFTKEFMMKLNYITSKY